MRNAYACLTILLILFNVAMASETFRKVAFLDPYSVLMELYDEGQLDTAGLSPASYFAQLDSLGIEMTLGRTDSAATSNIYSIDIIGQYGMREYSVPGWSGTFGFNELAHVAHIIESEVEYSSNQEDPGAYWAHYTGWLYSPPGQNRGWIMESGIHNPGLALKSFGPRWGVKYGNREMTPKIVMAVWDTESIDTVARFEFIQYYDKDTNWYYFTGQDFQGVLPGHWKEFYLEPFHVHSPWCPINARLYWTGAELLAVDEISLFDEFGLLYNSLSLAHVDSVVQDFYSRINTDNHGRFYPSDEPGPHSFGDVIFSMMELRGIIRITVRWLR